MEAVLKLISSIQEYRYLKPLPLRAISFAVDMAITKTVSRRYALTVIRKMDVGRIAVISFDCDTHEDVKAYEELLDVLKRFRIKSSFAVIGKLIELYPDEHIALIEDGHEIVNHTYTHPNSLFNPRRFTELSPDEMALEISKFDEVCMKTLEFKPIGFRAPHFLLLPRVYEILRNLGYIYSTSTVATRTKSLGRPYFVNGILEIPLTPCLKRPFATLSTWGLMRAPKRWYGDEEEFLSIFKSIVDFSKSFNSFLNFYFDPCDVVRMGVFEDMLKVVRSSYKIVPYREFASIYTSNSAKRSVCTDGSMKEESYKSRAEPKRSE